MKILFFGLLISFPFFSYANKAFEIMKKSRDANNGFTGDSSDMEMILISKNQDKVIRKLSSKTLETKDEGNKSLVTFLLPKDVAGTKMLTWSYRTKNDDQWIFMPTLKKVKKITSSGKSASFMGSEFSYEDLGSQELERFTYNLISEDENHWIIERFPKDKDSSYKKHKVHLSKEYLLPDYIEYYNRRNELFKKASFENFKKYNVNDKIMFRAEKVHMKNVKNQKESIVIWHNKKLGVKYKPSTFRKESLNETF